MCHLIDVIVMKISVHNRGPLIQNASQKNELPSTTSLLIFQVSRSSHSLVGLSLRTHCILFSCHFSHISLRIRVYFQHQFQLICQQLHVGSESPFRPLEIVSHLLTIPKIPIGYIYRGYQYLFSHILLTCRALGKNKRAATPSCHRLPRI